MTFGATDESYLTASRAARDQAVVPAARGDCLIRFVNHERVREADGVGA